jgi:bisanhydrobacterioruberin hydratase
MAKNEPLWVREVFLKQAFFPLSAAQRFRWSVAILSLVYSVGIAGILSPWKDWFVAMTPFSLLLSGALIGWNEPVSGRGILLFAVTSYLLGLLIEITGVSTGFPFGEYTYGEILGPKIGGAPWLIGINWFIISYGANEWVTRWGWSRRASIAAGALLPLCADFLIEPVAIHLGFWQWAQGTPPWQNYAGWCGVSLALALAYARTCAGKGTNPVAPWVFAWQILFFFLLNILHVG